MTQLLVARQTRTLTAALIAVVSLAAAGAAPADIWGITRTVLSSERELDPKRRDLNGREYKHRKWLAYDLDLAAMRRSTAEGDFYDRDLPFTFAFKETDTVLSELRMVQALTVRIGRRW